MLNQVSADMFQFGSLSFFKALVTLANFTSYPAITNGHRRKAPKITTQNSKSIGRKIMKPLVVL
jgi:hypothetical protein